MTAESTPDASIPRPTPGPVHDVAIDCGWGKLLFAHTYGDTETLVTAIRSEAPEERNIALYVTDPHVVLAAAPNELFLDPSHTFRLDLDAYAPSSVRPAGFSVEPMNPETDAEAVNCIYSLHNMVQVRPDFFSSEPARALTHLVARDEESGRVIGTVTGVDHVKAFDDPDRGSSLWCLAIDSQCAHVGVGEALIRALAEHYIALRRRYMDLSVLHDNTPAIALYKRLGFTRLPYFAIKLRNSINERLFVGPDPAGDMNPYARIIIDEARRRSIGVEVMDVEGGLFALTYGGRTIRCRESLSDLTSAVALSICDDKAMTRRIVEAAGVVVPEQVEASDPAAVEALLERHGSVVVKPARGEQGRGVAVDLTDSRSVEAAIAEARKISDRVLVERYHCGLDLRLVIIGFRLVAAAVRRPAEVLGDGRRTVRELIERQSRRREAATGGESRIVIDDETARCVLRSGFALDDVLPEGKAVDVRRTANLHTGGTIHDVTGEVHPRLVDAAVTVARVVDIPVVGVDFMVTSPRRPDYVFIEANERPGLANHEPQPTAQRFIDLLFPLSMPTAVREHMSTRWRSEVETPDRH